MIYVIERFFKKRNLELKAWRREGERWVTEMTDKHGYGYDFESWERRNPAPHKTNGRIIGTLCGSLGIFAVVALGVGSLLYVILHPKPVDPKNPNNCTVVVKKGDKVGVIAGDFDGSKGIIIDQRNDCSVNLTLTESTYTFDKAQKAGYEGSNSKENGAVLNVDRSSNIVKL